MGKPAVLIFMQVELANLKSLAGIYLRKEATFVLYYSVISWMKNRFLAVIRLF